MRLEPPTPPQPGRILRTILADKPRVTRFPIRWDNILDETVKKPEEEELDRDADRLQMTFEAANAAHDAAAAAAGEQESNDEDEDEDEFDDDDDDETGNADEEDDDEFTSQLGPEEQDRMSMMIDEDDVIHGGGAHAEMENVNCCPTDPNSSMYNAHAGAAAMHNQSMFKPSPLSHDNSCMMMMEDDMMS